MSRNRKTSLFDQLRLLPCKIKFVQKNIFHMITFETDKMMVMATFSQLEILFPITHNHTVNNSRSLHRC